MKQTTWKSGINKRLERYLERMQEIVSRMDVVVSVLQGDVTLPYPPAVIESVYLQFRMVLELIATASLVANDDAQYVFQEEYRKKRKRRLRSWHAVDILKAVERVNPDYYYPSPVRLAERNKGGLEVGIDGYRGEWLDYRGDYLTREKFMTLYNVCGQLLHTPNPFNGNAHRNRETDKNHMQQAPKWRRRIVELLTHHTFKLEGNEDTLYVCHTVGADAEFVVRSFQKLDVPDNSTPEDVAKARTLALASLESSDNLCPARGLTQDQINVARADEANPPKLDSVVDEGTKKPLVWRDTNTKFDSL